MKRQLMLTGFLGAATAPAWALTAGDLAKHERTMMMGLYVLIPAALILGIWEFVEWRKGGSDGLTLDIDRLAAAAAQKQARAVTPDPEPATVAVNQDSGGHRAVTAPPGPRGGSSAAPPPPPPPPPMRGAAPPPPPPPGRMDSGELSPFQRLSQMGKEESPAPSPSAGRPIGLPTAGGAPPPPPPPPGAGSGAAPAATGGGWADLLQRVRSGEPEGGAASGGGVPTPPPLAAWKSSEGASPSGEDERPAGMPPLPPMSPASGFPTPPPAPPPATGGGGSDAWEALLKKTTAGNAPPPPPAPGRPMSPMGAGLAGDSNPLSKLNLPSAGGESGGGGNPFAAALGNQSGSGAGLEGLGGGSSQDEALPDFVKKASRTISLDLKKGGGSTPPPPLPKTEG